MYPEENRDLYESILEKGGLILSESRLGTPYIAQLFTVRNRIVASMSRALVVIEAALKSGSLMTARLVAEYNREVFAVPGHPADPRSSGENFLLKNGAKMFEDISDLELEDACEAKTNKSQLAQCAHTQSTQGQVGALDLPKDDNLLEGNDLLDVLSCTAVSIEDLAVHSGLSVTEVRVQVIALELQGRARVLDDGCVIRV